MSDFEFDRRVVRINVAGKTDVGQRRRENQDAFIVADLTTPDEDDGTLLEPDVDTGQSVNGEFELGPKGALCLVADGMGGAAAGGVASNVAVVCIHEELRRYWTADRVSTPHIFAVRLKEAVEASNARIHEQGLADERFRGMGTTVTAVGVLDTFLYVAQVGDSRAYLVRNGEAVQLTRDQSYIQHLVDAGTLTEEEAEKSDHRNMILQALGTTPYVDVDLTYQEIRRGDLVIVCSDGLSKVVTKADLAETAGRAVDPARICEELVDLANLRGGPDNITVVAARFAGGALEDPTHDDTVERRVYALPR
jgi:PPM family protein phosphatase